MTIEELEAECGPRWATVYKVGPEIKWDPELIRKHKTREVILYLHDDVDVILVQRLLA